VELWRQSVPSLAAGDAAVRIDGRAGLGAGRGEVQAGLTTSPLIRTAWRSWEEETMTDVFIASRLISSRMRRQRWRQSCDQTETRIASLIDRLLIVVARSYKRHYCRNERPDERHGCQISAVNLRVHLHHPCVEMQTKPVKSACICVIQGAVIRKA